MSAAVDADLAAQIFRLVSAHNALRTLKLRPSGWHSYGGSLDQWLRWLGRRWVVTRCTTPGGGSVVALEAGVEERVQAGLAIDDSPKFANALRGQLKTIWLGLWPQKTEQWWEDWSSFPLATASGDERT